MAEYTLIPILTSNTSSSAFCTVSDSSNFGVGWAAWRSFNDNADPSTCWMTARPFSAPQWIQVQFVSPPACTGYAIRDRDVGNAPDTYPKSWTFEGSNNGTDWTVLDTHTNEDPWKVDYSADPTVHQFPVAQSSYYYYRIVVTAVQTGSDCQIGPIYIKGAISSYAGITTGNKVVTSGLASGAITAIKDTGRTLSVLLEASSQFRSLTVGRSLTLESALQSGKTLGIQAVLPLRTASVGLASGKSYASNTSRSLRVTASRTANLTELTTTRCLTVAAELHTGRSLAVSLNRNLSVVASVQAPGAKVLSIQINRSVVGVILPGKAFGLTAGTPRVAMLTSGLGKTFGATAIITRTVSAGTTPLLRLNLALVRSLSAVLGLTPPLISDTAESQVWLVNTKTGGHFTYDNGMAFTSLCQFDGEVYFTTAAGLFKLSGDVDQAPGGTTAETPITAVLTTGALDLGNKGNIHDAVISTRGGDVQLIAVVDEEFRDTAQVFAHRNDRRGRVNRRAKLAAGRKGKYWQFELGNVDGSICDMDSITVTPEVSRRSM